MASTIYTQIAILIMCLPISYSSAVPNNTPLGFSVATITTNKATIVKETTNREVILEGFNHNYISVATKTEKYRTMY